MKDHARSPVISAGLESARGARLKLIFLTFGNCSATARSRRGTQYKSNEAVVTHTLVAISRGKPIAKSDLSKDFDSETVIGFAERKNL